MASIFDQFTTGQQDTAAPAQQAGGSIFDNFKVKASSAPTPVTKPSQTNNEETWYSRLGSDPKTWGNVDGKEFRKSINSIGDFFLGGAKFGFDFGYDAMGAVDVALHNLVHTGSLPSKGVFENWNQKTQDERSKFESGNVSKFLDAPIKYMSGDSSPSQVDTTIQKVTAPVQDKVNSLLPGMGATANLATRGAMIAAPAIVGGAFKLAKGAVRAGAPRPEKVQTEIQDKYTDNQANQGPPAPPNDGGGTPQPTPIVDRRASGRTSIEESRRDISIRPTNPSQEEIDRLRAENAAQKQKLNTDTLTGVGTRESANAAEASGQFTHMAVLDMVGLSAMNTLGGHGVGDTFLQKATAPLKQVFGDNVHRLGKGADELAVYGKSEEELRSGLEQVKGMLANETISGNHGEMGPWTKTGIDIPYGIAEHKGDWKDTFSRADSQMEDAKTALKTAQGVGLRKGDLPAGITFHDNPVNNQMELPGVIPKGQTGAINPKLLATMGGTALATMYFLTHPNENTDPSDWNVRVWDAAKGVGATMAGVALIRQMPSIFGNARYMGKIAFMDSAAAKMGPEYRDAAGQVWEEKTPEGIKNSDWMKQKNARANAAEIQQWLYEAQGAKTAAHVVAMQAIEGMRKDGYTADKLEALWGLEEGKPVPEELQHIYDTVYQPARQFAADKIRQISEITGKSYGEIDGFFMPRLALERRNAIQKLFEENINFAAGSKPSQLQPRSLFDVGGTTIHVDDKGNVLAFKDGKTTDLGQIKGSMPKIGEDVVTDQGKIGKLGQATRNQIEANSPIKYWKDPVSTQLIKNAELASRYDQLVVAKRISERPDFHEAIARPEDSNPPKDWRALQGYARDALPMFRGMKVAPRYAEAIEDVLNPASGALGLEKLNNIFTKMLLVDPIPHINNEAVHFFFAGGATNMPKAFFMNEWKDAHNSVVTQDSFQLDLQRHMNMMYTTRWLDNTVGNLVKNELRGLEELPATQDIAKATGMKAATVANYISDRTGDFMWIARDTMVTKLVKQEIANNPVLTELMKTNQSEAIKIAAQKVSSAMPNYRLPPRIMEEAFSNLLGDSLGGQLSRQVSKIGQNQLLTSFFRYHYAVYSELAKTGQAAVGLDGKEAVAHGLNGAAALLAMYLVYNTAGKAVGQAAAKFAGLNNDDARLRPAGTLSALDKWGKVAGAYKRELNDEPPEPGDDNAVSTAVSSIVAKPLWFSLLEAGVNSRFPENKPVADPLLPPDIKHGEQVRWAAGQVLPGGSMVSDNPSDAPSKASQMLLRGLDIVGGKTDEQQDKIDKALKFHEGRGPRSALKRYEKAH